MHRHLFIGTIIFISMLSLSLSGCGKPDDSTNKSMPVAKKIISQEKKEVPDEKQKSTQPATLPTVTPSAKPTSDVAVDPATIQTEEKTVPSVEDTKKEEIAVTAVDSNKPSSELYNPIGKIDPFAPLFTDEQTVEENKETPTKKPRRSHLTPLEKIDLSQLSLLGTILASSGNRAMVADSDGKGYVITIGSYIGISSGRVIEILKDRIVVEEEVENILGKTSLQKRELKIQKPLGE